LKPFYNFLSLCCLYFFIYLFVPLFHRHLHHFKKKSDFLNVFYVSSHLLFIVTLCLPSSFTSLRFLRCVFPHFLCIIPFLCALLSVFTFPSVCSAISTLPAIPLTHSSSWRMYVCMYLQHLDVTCPFTRAARSRYLRVIDCRQPGATYMRAHKES
jgi:hypothetical protein